MILGFLINMINMILILKVLKEVDGNLSDCLFVHFYASRPRSDKGLKGSLIVPKGFDKFPTAKTFSCCFSQNEY